MNTLTRLKRLLLFIYTLSRVLFWSLVDEHKRKICDVSGTYIGPRNVRYAAIYFNREK